MMMVMMRGVVKRKKKQKLSYYHRRVIVVLFSAGVYLSLLLFQSGMFTNTIFFNFPVEEEEERHDGTVGMDGGGSETAVQFLLPSLFSKKGMAPTTITATNARRKRSRSSSSHRSTSIAIAEEPSTKSVTGSSQKKQTNQEHPTKNQHKQQIQKKDRIITLVHVGKAGGVSLRSETAVACVTSAAAARSSSSSKRQPIQQQQQEEEEDCIRRLIHPGNVLASSIRYYFHMDFGIPKPPTPPTISIDTTTRAESPPSSSSFLFLLRNPIDRIISSYRFQHPKNCNRPIYHQPGKGRPFGCVVDEQKLSSQYLLYTLCFPNPSMEEFAQSTLMMMEMGTPSSSSPTTSTSSSLGILNNINLTLAQQSYCRWTARRAVQGRYHDRAGPHFFYNYEYYRNRTILAFPTREVFGIRTTGTTTTTIQPPPPSSQSPHKESEGSPVQQQQQQQQVSSSSSSSSSLLWEDMKELDIALGGNGIFRNHGSTESHGSEYYEPSPLSKGAYRKLCCVLEKEISIYQDIVSRVVNFNDTIKHDCMEEIRMKCGILQDNNKEEREGESLTSWEEWRNKCKQQLAADEKDLMTLVEQGREEFKELMKLKPPPLPSREERAKQERAKAKEDKRYAQAIVSK